MQSIKRLMGLFGNSDQKILHAPPESQLHPQRHTSPRRHTSPVRTASPTRTRSRFQPGQPLLPLQQEYGYSTPLPSPQQELGRTRSRSHRVDPHHRHRSRHHESKEPRSWSNHKHSSGTVNMPSESFVGPSCGDLVEFMKSVKDMPTKHKGAFNELSKKTIETVCDINALHVWESGDDMDELLQLTQVIIKLKIEAAKWEGLRGIEPAMVIISCEKLAAKSNRDAFSRICDLVGHITSNECRKHLDGTVCAFDAIVVVRGVSYSPKIDDKPAIKRINMSIERALIMQRPSIKRVVWHHGPTISFLLTWINTTTSELRSSLTAITITAALDLTAGVKPSPLGKANTPNDIKRLEKYAQRLGIPVLFVDPSSQLISFQHLSTYMFFWASYIHLLFPAPLLRTHFHLGLDALVTFCFRLFAASTSKFGAPTVRAVKEHLTASLATPWARTAIDPDSYNKQACRAAGSDSSIHNGTQLADAPFDSFVNLPTYPFPAFSRLPLCPVENPRASATGQKYFAAPVGFDTSRCRMRVESGARFHVLLPSEGVDVGMVTGYVRGTMMGVVECIRRDKDKSGEVGFTADIEKGNKEAWADVVKACQWALEQCKGKMPEGMEEKVGCVGKKLGDGTYSFAVGKKGKTGGEWHAEQASQGWGVGFGYGAQVPGWGQGENSGGGWFSGKATMGGPWG